jgi:hypothetical protein
MFDAIVQNMEAAREDGDLYQGSVSTTPKPEKPKSSPQKQNITLPQSPSNLNSLVSEAIQTQQDLLKESQESQQVQSPQIFCPKKEEEPQF